MLNRKIRGYIFIICILNYSKSVYSMEEISTEGLAEVDFGKVTNAYDSLSMYEQTIQLKILWNYINLLSNKEMEPVMGGVKAKILILPDGTVKGVEFISKDIKKETENSIRELIDIASPFNKFPNKLAKITTVFEYTYTFNSPHREQSNKALHGINP